MNKTWQIVAIFIAGMLFLGSIAGIIYFWNKNNELKTALEASEGSLEFQKLIYDESVKAWRKNTEVTNALYNTLKEDNKKLYDDLKARNAEIVSLTKVGIEWKGKYLGIKETVDDIKDYIVDSNGETLPAESIPAECAELRYKVDFKKEDGYLGVKGWTLTNPAEAGINVYWTKPLDLNVVISRSKDKKTYIANLTTSSDDFFPYKLDVKIDPSLFKKRWYERFWLGGDLMIGKGNAGTNLGIYYEFGKLLIGPKIGLHSDLESIRVMYGGGILWNL